MKKTGKIVFLVFLWVFLMSLGGFAQVEIHLFGQYNFNLTYPEDITVDPDVQSIFSSYTDEWKAFLGPILEQEDGLGFGGRIAFNITPNLAIEGTFEYNLVATAFAGTVVDDVIAAESSYSDAFTVTRSGGSLIRYYGNVVFNIPSAGNITPYITAGAGITQFNIKKGEGPELDFRVKWGALTAAHMHVYYENTSALTLNGGLGVKIKFSPNFGIRLDGRVFYTAPEINQYLDHTFFGITLLTGENSTVLSGTHVDGVLNAGLFLAL